MVIGHDPHSFSNQNSSQEKVKTIYPAPRLDRFAAGLVDATIVTMLAKVFAAQAIYSLKVSASFSLDQAMLASFFNVFWLTFAVFLIYSVATYRLFKRSLGEILFSIQTVTSTNHKIMDQYTFVLRTFLSYVGVLLVFPIVSIFLNRDGRTFYDKICETLVITTRTGVRRLNFYLPYDKLVGSCLVISLFVGLSYSSLYLSKNVFKFSSDFEKNNHVCNYINDFHQAWSDQKIGESRLEVALALYSADELSASCLKREIDFELQVNPNSSTAYFAKGYLHLDDKTKFFQYYLKTCELDSSSVGCHVATWMTFWPNTYEGETKLDLNMLPMFGKIWLIKRNAYKGNLVDLAKNLEEIPVPKGLEGFYVENLMKTEYFRGNSQKLDDVVKLAENKNQNPRQLKEKFCGLAVSESCQIFDSISMCTKLNLNRSKDQHLQNMSYACQGNSKNIFSSDTSYEDFYISLAKKSPLNLESLKKIFMSSKNPFNVRFATLNSFFNTVTSLEYLKTFEKEWEESSSKDFIWRLTGEHLKASFKNHGDLQSSFYVFKRLAHEYSEIKFNDNILNYAKEISRVPAQSSDVTESKTSRKKGL